MAGVQGRSGVAWTTATTAGTDRLTLRCGIVQPLSRLRNAYFISLLAPDKSRARARGPGFQGTRSDAVLVHLHEGGWLVRRGSASFGIVGVF